MCVRVSFVIKLYNKIIPLFRWDIRFIVFICITLSLVPNNNNDNHMILSFYFFFISIIIAVDHAFNLNILVELWTTVRCVYRAYTLFDVTIPFGMPNKIIMIKWVDCFLNIITALFYYDYYSNICGSFMWLNACTSGFKWSLFIHSWSE